MALVRVDESGRVAMLSAGKCCAAISGDAPDVAALTTDLFVWRRQCCCVNSIDNTKPPDGTTIYSFYRGHKQKLIPTYQWSKPHKPINMQKRCTYDPIGFEYEYNLIVEARNV